MPVTVTLPSKITSKSSDSPVIYDPSVGGVIDVATGATASTRTLATVGGVKVRMALLRPASRIVPPLRMTGELRVTPFVSR